MRQNTPEDTSARTNSPRFSTDNFDRVLPREALEELSRATHSRGRVAETPEQRHVPPSQKRFRLGWLLALVGLVMLGAVIYLGWPSPAKRAAALQESAARGRETRELADRALNALSGAPVQQSAPAIAISPAVQTPAAAPRAELVPVTVKRAERVLRIGVWNQVWMPDRLTWIRFWGVKDTFADLPSSPQMGDAWGVKEDQTGSLWVWHLLPEHISPAWVDP